MLWSQIFEGFCSFRLLLHHIHVQFLVLSGVTYGGSNLNFTVLVILILTLTLRGDSRHSLHRFDPQFCTVKRSFSTPIFASQAPWEDPVSNLHESLQIRWLGNDPCAGVTMTLHFFVFCKSMEECSRARLRHVAVISPLPRARLTLSRYLFPAIFCRRRAQNATRNKSFPRSNVKNVRAPTWNQFRLFPRVRRKLFAGVHSSLVLARMCARVCERGRERKEEWLIRTVREGHVKRRGGSSARA